MPICTGICASAQHAPVGMLPAFSQVDSPQAALDRQEVMRRLRALNQAVTLFGEVRPPATASYTLSHPYCMPWFPFPWLSLHLWYCRVPINIMPARVACLLLQAAALPAHGMCMFTWLNTQLGTAMLRVHGGSIPYMQGDYDRIRRLKRIEKEMASAGGNNAADDDDVRASGLSNQLLEVSRSKQDQSKKKQKVLEEVLDEHSGSKVEEGGGAGKAADSAAEVSKQLHRNCLLQMYSMC